MQSELAFTLAPMNSKTENSSIKIKKSAYHKPALTCYGNIAQITHTADGDYSDNYQKNCNHNQTDQQGQICS